MIAIACDEVAVQEYPKRFCLVILHGHAGTNRQGTCSGALFVSHC